MRNWTPPPEGVPRVPRNRVSGLESDDAGRGDLAGQKEGLAALPAKLDRYGLARHRATQVLAHLDAIANPGPYDRPTRAAAKLRDCGDYLGFRHYPEPDLVRLHRASLCRQHLVCPLCAIRRSAKLVGRYVQRFEALTREDPALRPVFITYTVRNGPDLAERMAHLRAGLRRLTRERAQARRRAKAGGCTWKHVAGAVGALEATWSAKAGWHPHMHMVGLCDGWMDQREMVAEWKAITGDSFVVGIQQIDPARPPADAFAEALKYAVKFGSMPAAKIWEAAEELRGQRLAFSLGGFRGIPEPADLLDEQLDGLPWVELLYRYLGGGHYGLASWGAPQSPSSGS